LQEFKQRHWTNSSTKILKTAKGTTSGMSTSVRGLCYANCYSNLCSVVRKMRELENRCSAGLLPAAQTHWLSWTSKCLHSR